MTTLLPTPPATDVPTVLRRAADLIERWGLYQDGGFWPMAATDDVGGYTFGCPACAVGAMYVAAGHVRSPDFLSGNQVAQVAPVYGAVGAVGRHLARTGGDDDVTEWSDDPARSAAEVVATLREVADLEETA